MSKFDTKLSKSSGCFGYEGPMGIPSWDQGVEKAGVTPTKNKFSWMEMSQEETMRAVKGKGTSSMMMKKEGTASTDIRRMRDSD